MLVKLTHEAGGRTEREARVKLSGIYVDWGMAGEYWLYTRGRRKGHIKCVKDGAGWSVDMPTLRVLMDALNKERRGSKK